ncbi:MAG: cell division protein FtsQ/DivIB [Ardenticatenaceae bacterium]
MRLRRHRSWLQKLSRRLTFNKLTVGKGRQARRSQRLNVSESEVLATQPSFIATMIRWLSHRLSWFVALWIFVILLYVAFGTTWFYIYDIEVEGVQRLTKEEIYNHSKLEGWSMFWLNTEAVARLVEQEPWVADAQVSPLLPNGVRIRIDERVPVAIWQSGKISYFVDRDGVLFDIREQMELPIIRDLYTTNIEANDEIDPMVVGTVVKLAELMPGQTLFDWKPETGVFITTEQEWDVIFGDDTRLSSKVAAFRTFSKAHHSDNKIVWLDLSVLEDASYKMKP